MIWLMVPGLSLSQLTHTHMHARNASTHTFPASIISPLQPVLSLFSGNDKTNRSKHMQGNLMTLPQVNTINTEDN